MVKKYKRYKYNKVTPELVEKMKKLRNGKLKLSYKKIGDMFGLSHTTVKYHLVKKFREQLKNISRKQKKKYNKKYNAKYQKERYNNDEKFKERTIDLMKKLKKTRLKLHLCLMCGGEVEDEQVHCKSCREKRNKKLERERNKRRKEKRCIKCNEKLKNKKYDSCDNCRSGMKKYRKKKEKK